MARQTIELKVRKHIHNKGASWIIQNIKYIAIGMFVFV